ALPRLAAPVPLDTAKLLEPAVDARAAQRILDHRTQGLALGLRQSFGVPGELGRKGDGFLDCRAHDAIRSWYEEIIPLGRRASSRGPSRWTTSAPDAPLSQWSRGFSQGHSWLEEPWDACPSTAPSAP